MTLISEKKVITKEKLAIYLSKQMGFSARICTEIVNIFFDELIKLLMQDKQISFKNFGKFTINHKNERPVLNISKKEALTLPARNVLSFKASSNLKSIINEYDEKLENKSTDKENIGEKNINNNELIMNV